MSLGGDHSKKVIWAVLGSMQRKGRVNRQTCCFTLGSATLVAGIYSTTAWDTNLLPGSIWIMFERFLKFSMFGRFKLQEIGMASLKKIFRFPDEGWS